MQTITVFRHGFQLYKHVGGTVSPCLSTNETRRGCVSEWSRASRRRLRQALCELSGPGTCFGCTLTLPGNFEMYGIWFDFCVLGYLPREEISIHLIHAYVFRVIVHRWANSLKYSGIPAIYRVELQRNGKPHIHCVCWVDFSRQQDFFSLYNSWLNSLKRTYIIDKVYGLCPLFFLDGALLHSVHIEKMDEDCLSAYRYLCDHASKMKRDQLGYQGRQWGIVNRCFLHSSRLCDFELTDAEYDRVLRMIRKLSHCNVSRGNGGRTVWFTRPLTLARMVDFVRQGVKYDSTENKLPPEGGEIF